MMMEKNPAREAQNPLKTKKIPNQAAVQALKKKTTLIQENPKMTEIMIPEIQNCLLYTSRCV